MELTVSYINDTHTSSYRFCGRQNVDKGYFANIRYIYVSFGKGKEKPKRERAFTCEWF